MSYESVRIKTTHKFDGNICSDFIDLLPDLASRILEECHMSIVWVRNEDVVYIECRYYHVKTVTVNWFVDNNCPMLLLDNQCPYSPHSMPPHFVR